MARLLHWKTTVAMASFYAVVAALLLAFVRDTTALLAMLFVAFSLVLLAGNLFVRAREVRAQRAGGRGSGAVPDMQTGGGVQDMWTAGNVQDMRTAGGLPDMPEDGSRSGRRGRQGGGGP